MNIPESRDFVVEQRPFCCGKRVDEDSYTSMYELGLYWQHFICRISNKKIQIKYWPLYESDIRELKLNVILNEQ